MNPDPGVTSSCHQRAAKLQPPTTPDFTTTGQLSSPHHPAMSNVPNPPSPTTALTLSQDLQPGTLNWRLSAHPITLCTFLAFRLCPSLPPPPPRPPLTPHSLHPHLPPRHVVLQQLRPHLHHRNPPPLRRLLLHEKHRGTAAGGSPLVERNRALGDALQRQRRKRLGIRVPAGG